MAQLTCVLDTNLSAFGSEDDMRQLASCGLRLRLSEIGFSEWWVRSVRNYTQRGESRKKARKFFFGRAKSIAPYLDEEQPIAVGAGILAQKVSAEESGLPTPPEFGQRAHWLTAVWRIIVGQELWDEEWIEQANLAGDFLTQLDRTLRLLARRDDEIDGEIYDQLTPAEKEMHAHWRTLSKPEKRPHLEKYIAQTLRLTDTAAERFDGFIKTMSFHCIETAAGARQVKENDGADLSALLHLADDSVLVSKDGAFFSLVDGSGTYQAPWLRRLTELNDLPTFSARGDSARALAAGFTRLRQ